MTAADAAAAAATLTCFSKLSKPRRGHGQIGSWLEWEFGHLFWFTFAVLFNSGWSVAGWWRKAAKIWPWGLSCHLSKGNLVK